MKRFLLLILTAALHAQADELLLDANKRIEIPISNSGVNRLLIANDRILKIVGAEDDNIIEGETRKGQAFIVSKLNTDQKAFATIISEKGIIQDVVFKVDSEAPYTITLKRPKGKARKLEESITSKIQDIFSGRTKVFKARDLSEKTLNKLPFQADGVEYVSAAHRYILLNSGSIENFNALKNLPGIIAIAKRNNNLIMVEK